MIGNTVKTVGAVFTIAAAIAVVAVPAASAKGRDGVRVAGTCGDTSTSKLKVKSDRGRLKVEFEVDQNVSGVVWDVKLSNDGKVLFQGRRTTKAPSGSFSVERRVKRTTSGAITASATRNGEVCSATLTVPAKAGVVAVPVTDPATAVGHDANDDNGNAAAGHDVNDDRGNHAGDPAHDANEDDHGRHGNDD